jgi:predicted MFS family arabinose efflux permease
MKKQGISLTVMLSAWVVGIAILAILGYRVYTKVGTAEQSSMWMDIILMAVAIALVVRVMIMYKKQK